MALTTAEQRELLELEAEAQGIPAPYAGLDNTELEELIGLESERAAQLSFFEKAQQTLLPSPGVFTSPRKAMQAVQKDIRSCRLSPF